MALARELMRSCGVRPARPNGLTRVGPRQLGGGRAFRALRGGGGGSDGEVGAGGGEALAGGAGAGDWVEAPEDLLHGSYTCHKSRLTQ